MDALFCEECGDQFDLIQHVAVSDGVRRAWWIPDRALCIRCGLEQDGFPPPPMQPGDADQVQAWLTTLDAKQLILFWRWVTMYVMTRYAELRFG